MTRFFKLSGGGNDFIALAEPGSRTPAAAIRSWCRRGLSLGADGVFELQREDGGGIRMRHYNPDGGLARLCLNGTRCAARLAFHLGWAQGSTTLLTDAGPVSACESEEGIRLRLDPPGDRPRLLELEAGDRRLQGWLTVVGVPHLVLLWQESLAQAPVAELGRRLVHHRRVGPDGTNVDFVRVAGEGRFEIRTYERGVYGETLACGSGVLASAQVLVEEQGAAPPLEALTAGGFVLRVEGRLEAGRLADWSLAGDARLVAEGRILAGAEQLPDPPEWSAGGDAFAHQPRRDAP